MATRNLGQKVPRFKENLKLRNFVTYPIQEAKFYVVTTPREHVVNQSMVTHHSSPWLN